MNKILLTGGAGFIGANFIRFWKNIFLNDKIIILDKLTSSGNIDNINDLLDSQNIFFIKGDICSHKTLSNIFKKYDPNIIINFAAESHVDNSIANPDNFIKTNILGTYNLLKNSTRHWLDDNKKLDHLFYHVSTDEVYGSLNIEEVSFTEKNQYKPNSPYAASKASSDHLVRAYNKTFNLNTIISNCSNNYGPYQNIEKFIPKTITNILKGLPIPIYGNGEQIRDWIHVNDHCEAIKALIEHRQYGSNFNIGDKNEFSNIYVVKLICKYIDEIKSKESHLLSQYPISKVEIDSSSELISFVKDRKGHDFRYSIDSSKIKKKINFHTKKNFKIGIKETIYWYINNSNAWNKKFLQ